MIADGPAEIARAVRLCFREGVDNIKVNISGDDFVRRQGRHDGDARGGDAHGRGRGGARLRQEGRVALPRGRVRASARVRCGVDVIYHCEFADEEALDLLEAAKHRIFVGPAIGLIHNTLYEAEALGHHARGGLHDGHAAHASRMRSATYEQMRKRGIRVVIGGDYGFAVTPQGTNARDIEHFVEAVRLLRQRGAAMRDAHRRRADGHGASSAIREEATSPTCCSSTATRCATWRCCSGKSG